MNKILRLPCIHFLNSEKSIVTFIEEDDTYTVITVDGTYYPLRIRSHPRLKLILLYMFISERIEPPTSLDRIILTDPPCDYMMGSYRGFLFTSQDMLKVYEFFKFDEDYIEWTGH